jgi:tyrosine-protein phosphatase SIW14
MTSNKITNVSRFSITAALVFGIASLPAAAQTNVAGVPNFHEINDHLYRGAQPSKDGFQNLAKLGVKTVIDLREPSSRSTAEQKEVEAAGMRYVAIPFHGMSAPSAENVAKVLALFDNATAGPVFVHCRQGMDRTGTVVACYRIAHDGWDNRKALREAKGFGMHWTEIAMQHYVLGYHPPVNTAATGVATAAAANN